MSEVWNNVTVIGPALEIDRFKRLCIHPDEDISRHGQSGWDGCSCYISVPTGAERKASVSPDLECSEYVWNFQQFTRDDATEYSFSFDTDFRFPIGLFERLALRFPTLAFDCACIESLDEFMGYGWFNKPNGGEDFEQDYDVPETYWTTGSGYKRSHAAQLEHEARIAKLKDAARAKCI